MTVGELKKIINRCHDNTIILVPGEDHSYNHVYVFERNVLKQPGLYFCEYYDYVPLEDGEQVVKALVIE
jgi:hypothetical protein